MRSLVPLALLVGCSGPSSNDDGPGDTVDTDDTDPTRPDPTVDTGFEGPWVTTDDNGDGTFTTVIASISTIDWVWFSFMNGEVAVGPDDPGGWDVRFQREVVQLNSATSGSGTVEAARLDRVALAEVRWPPVGGWVVDTTEDRDGDGYEDWALFSWFDYDYDTHTLMAADRSFVIRTPDGDVRIRFETYYNEDDGNSGYPKFTWGWLPDEPNPLTDNAGVWTVDTAGGPVHLSLGGQVALQIATPDASPGWDVGLTGTGAVLNNTGGGLTAASTSDGFGEVTMPPGGGYGPDLDAAFTEGPPGTWTPADLTWVVKHPDGAHDKVRFESTTSLRTEAL